MVAKVLYLGTSNPDKATHLTELVQMVDERLVVRGILNRRLTPPREEGSTEREIAVAKAAAYAARLGETVLSEDSGIHFHQSLPVAIGVRIGDANSRIKGSKLRYWSDLFRRCGASTGYLRKAYAIVTPTARAVATVDIPFRLTQPRRLPAGTRNVFNYFMVPKSFRHAVAALAPYERRRFRALYLVPPLRTILAEVGITAAPPRSPAPHE